MKYGVASTASRIEVGLGARLAHLGGVGGVFLVLVLASASPREVATQTISAVYLIANVSLMIGDVFHPRRGGIALMVAFFFTFFVALPAAVQVHSGVFPFSATYSDSQIGTGFSLVALAQLAYQGGTALARSRRKNLKSDAPPWEFDSRTHIVFAWISLFAAAALILLAGPAHLFVARYDISYSAESETISQQLLMIARPLTLVALLTVLLLRKRRLPVALRPGLALTLTAAALAMVAHFPTALPRFQLLGAILVIAAASVNMFSRVIKTLFVTGSALFLFYLFPAIKELGTGDLDRVTAALGGNASAYLVRVDFDVFKQLIDTSQYVVSNPLRWGENFMGVVLFWIPRSVWDSKPTGTGHIVASAAGYEYTNVSSPLFAEGLISFGTMGLVAIMLLAGVAVAAVEQRVTTSFISDASLAPMVLYSLMVGYSTIILRGALNSVAPMFMTAFVAWALMHWATTPRPKVDAPRIVRRSGASIRVRS